MEEMKIKISILIILIFSLSSCNINQENNEIKQKQINFENNIKCNNSFKGIIFSKYSIENNSCIIFRGKGAIVNMFTGEILFSCEKKYNSELEKCKSISYNKFIKIK